MKFLILPFKYQLLFKLLLKFNRFSFDGFGRIWGEICNSSYLMCFYFLAKKDKNKYPIFF